MPRHNGKRYPHRPFGGKAAKATLFIPPPLAEGRLVYTTASQRGRHVAEPLKTTR